MAFNKTTLQYGTQLTVTEILPGNVVGLSDKTVKHSTLNKAATLDADSTPPVTKVATFRQLLTAGAATIDLTALVGTNGAAVDGTGLKVQAIKFIALADNANAIAATFGAANPYNLKGAAWNISLLAGQEDVFYGNDATPDIAAGAKDIDLAGTGTQGVDVEIVMG